MIVNKIGYNPYSVNNFNPNNIRRAGITSEKIPFTSDFSVDNRQNDNQKSIFLWTAGALISAITGLALLGRKIHNDNILKQIPKELQKVFAQLKGKKGKTFVNTAYTEMGKYLGLSGLIPYKITAAKEDSITTITGRFIANLNMITFTKGFWSKLAQEKQINFISHELTHAKQYITILRTEGLGAKALADVFAENSINYNIQTKRNISFNTAYEKAKASGHEKEFLEQVKKQSAKEYDEQIVQNYVEVLKLPKFKNDSAEGIKGQQYLDAQRVYVSSDVCGYFDKRYRGNLLEVEAYDYGDKISELYKKYCSLW